MAGNQNKENLEVNNHFLSATNPRDVLGITLEKPKFPQYAVVSKRVDSFKPWPEYLPLKPDVLVEAGQNVQAPAISLQMGKIRKDPQKALQCSPGVKTAKIIETGVGDSVRCYHCGGGLRNWEEGDVPFEEHAKWYPTCPHVLLVKGQSYVDALLKGEKPDQDETISTTVAEASDIPISELMNSAAAQSCIQNGISENIVRKAIQRYQDLNNKNTDFTGTQLCQIVFDLEESSEPEPPHVTSDASSVVTRNVTHTVTSNVTNLPTGDNDNEMDSRLECNNLPSDSGLSTCSTVESEDLDDLLSENQRLKENQMCKICLDAVANVIFLPCGHMVSCPQCAPALNKCPICRNCVKGYVKAYFGILEDKK